eukprot:TRINITY_DN122820_c0_g1_i1.p1 TRINITY_DN122820_c0_g1~~TRINITY_DN122820_c0_g1_i1.p1  ORF type:complete len:454 (-),score=74.28 TRINITY_DN122820_c0_g1_i1:267-1628(-)
MEVSLTTASPLALEAPRVRRRRLVAMSLLLLFIFLALFLPSEPYLVDFLVSKGLNKEDVSDKVFPIWTYARLPALLMTGLLAELLGNAPILFLGSLFSTATVFLTQQAWSLLWIQVTQLTVSVSTAAHSSCMFAMVLELSTGQNRQRNVHWAKTSLLLSSFLASVTGDLLIRDGVPYEDVWDISLTAQVAATLVALVLFVLVLVSPVARVWAPRVKCFVGCDMWRDVLHSLALQAVMEWVLFTVAAHISHIMVATNWQVLMRHITGKRHDDNGFISAVCYLLGAFMLLVFADAKALARRENRRTIIIVCLFFNILFVYCMGIAAQPWQLGVAYCAYQAVFRVGSATFLQQVGMEVYADAAPDGGEDSLAAPPQASPILRRQPRMALLLTIVSLFEALCQSVVQYSFLHTYKADGKRYPMNERFVILAVLLACASLLGIVVLVALSSRRQQPRC